VTPDAVEQELARIIRDELLMGSERPLPFDAPLGELGLGLDSLALVNLLTAAEAAFGVELSDDIWTARGPLSIGGLAEIIRRTPRTVAAAASLERASPVLHGRLERVENRLSRYGPVGRAAWAAVRATAPAARFLYSNTRHLLLERRLDEPGADPLKPPPGIELRPLQAKDVGGLSNLWAPVHARRSQRALERSLGNGALALVACEEDRVLALDLVSADGDEEVDVVRPDACFGAYLTEAREARGRGIGLALIAYSFRIARERGFQVQLTHVWDGNTAMLASATQLLGFRRFGVARRTRVAGFTRWSWQEDGNRHSGPRLVL
jgi:acyl carrier protein/GNAT superfamily N-acetyltransferase